MLRRPTQAAQIHYRIGSDPCRSYRHPGTLYTGEQILVAPPGPRTIKAIVIDGAGNVSPVASFTYTIGAITAPGAPTIGTATAGNASATVNWTPPANNGGRRSPSTAFGCTTPPAPLSGT